MAPIAPAPPILVAILNWNTPELALRAVDAVRQSTGCEFRISLIDNGSVDGSVTLFQRLAPDVPCLALAENLGFAGGHAAALAYARTQGFPLVCLLNSDVIVAPDALAALLAAWQQHGTALYAGVPWRWQRGRRMINLPQKYLRREARPRAWRRDRPVALTADWLAQPPQRVGAVPGSCLLVPLELVERYGFMGTEWFLYCEELDWCLRLREAGVQSVLVTAALVQHVGGGSSQRPGQSELRATIAYYQARNEIVLANRHAGRWTAVQIAGKKLLRAAALMVWSPRQAVSVLQGIRDAARGHMGMTRRPALQVANDRLRRWPLGLERAMDHLRERLRRGGWVSWAAGGSVLRTQRAAPRCIRAFHDHARTLLQHALIECPVNVQAGLGVPGQHPAATRQWRIELQVEHTLVRPGGRDSAGAEPGPVAVADSAERYCVRLVDVERLAAADLILDYSRPNLTHLDLSGHFPQLRARMLAIVPLWYRCSFDAARRDLPLITQFADLGQLRRQHFLDAARQAGLHVENVRGIWSTTGLRRLYRRTRILINVHQTDHHHTFEELRVLPALANGVIVISEDVPLRAQVPYHEYIVWARTDELVHRIAEVQADYAGWQRRIFGDGRLELLLRQLAIESQQQVRAALRTWLSTQGTARPMPAS